MGKKVSFKEFDISSRGDDKSNTDNIASPKSKKWTYFLIAVIVIAIIATISFKFYSQYAFDSFLKNFQNNANEVFDSYKKGRDLGNNSNKLWTELNTDDVSKAQRNKEILVSLKRNDEEGVKLDKESLLMIKKWAKETESIKNLPLWLNSDQKSLINNFYLATKEYKETSEKYVSADDEILLGFNAWLDELEAMIDLSVFDSVQRTPEQTRDSLKEISTLEKYSRQNFSFTGLSQFSLDYPHFYEFLETYKDFLASYYNAITAKAIRDEANYNSNAQKNYMLSLRLSSYSDPSKEITERVSRSFHKSIINADEKIIFTVNSYKNNKLAQSMYITDMLSSALFLFSYDHNSKFPATNDVNEMVNTLKNNNYIDKDISANNSFEYKSDGNDFKISFTNDWTGQKEVVEYLSK